MKNKFILFATLTLCFLAFSINTFAAPVTRTANGVNAAAIQATVDQFRADLGGGNNGVGNSFTGGRREINWDGVPDSFSDPNFLPSDFFNANSPRGVFFQAIEDRSATGNQGNDFIVSADSSNPTNTPVRYGAFNASFPTNFTTFSSERLFVANNTHLIEILFYIPGTKTPATVNGFGVVFTDVDSGVSDKRTIVRYYGKDGRELVSPVIAATQANGLSFVGVSFNAGERISKVIIESGVCDIGCGGTDGNDIDVVAMDDFIYGEPRAAEFHTGDFDGDGVSDTAVYRPSTGNWFVLNSGSNTFQSFQFGLNGDIPINGDFDGDSRADLAIYRPSNGVWFFQRSSDNTTLGVNFGNSTDKPVPGDYDKDGKTDIAVWRQSTGDWFVLRSSTNFTTFFGFPFGQNGDIPITREQN